MFKKVFVRSAHNYDRRQASIDSTLHKQGEMVTQQHQKDEADINFIMKKFGQTGLVPAVDRIPVKGDFAEIFDFQTALNAVVSAKEAFMALPANVRSEFANDPARYVKFCTEEDKDGKLKNLVRMRELGLAKPEVPVVKQKPTEVVLVDPA